MNQQEQPPPSNFNRSIAPRLDYRSKLPVPIKPGSVELDKISPQAFSLLVMLHPVSQRLEQSLSGESEVDPNQVMAYYLCIVDPLLMDPSINSLFTNSEKKDLLRRYRIKSKSQGQNRKAALEALTPDILQLASRAAYEEQQNEAKIAKHSSQALGSFVACVVLREGLGKLKEYYGKNSSDSYNKHIMQAYTNIHQNGLSALNKQEAQLLADEVFMNSLLTGGQFLNNLLKAFISTGVTPHVTEVLLRNEMMILQANFERRFTEKALGVINYAVKKYLEDERVIGNYPNGKIKIPTNIDTRGENDRANPLSPMHNINDIHAKYPNHSNVIGWHELRAINAAWEAVNIQLPNMSWKQFRNMFLLSQSGIQPETSQQTQSKALISKDLQSSVAVILEGSRYGQSKVLPYLNEEWEELLTENKNLYLLNLFDPTQERGIDNRDLVAISPQVFLAQRQLEFMHKNTGIIRTENWAHSEFAKIFLDSVLTRALGLAMLEKGEELSVDEWRKFTKFRDKIGEEVKDAVHEHDLTVKGFIDILSKYAEEYGIAGLCERVGIGIEVFQHPQIKTEQYEMTSRGTLLAIHYNLQPENQEEQGGTSFIALLQGSGQNNVGGSKIQMFDFKDTMDSGNINGTTLFMHQGSMTRELLMSDMSKVKGYGQRYAEEEYMFLLDQGSEVGLHMSMALQPRPLLNLHWFKPERATSDGIAEYLAGSRIFGRGRTIVPEKQLQIMLHNQQIALEMERIKSEKSLGFARKAKESGNEDQAYVEVTNVYDFYNAYKALVNFINAQQNALSQVNPLNRAENTEMWKKLFSQLGKEYKEKRINDISIRTFLNRLTILFNGIPILRELYPEIAEPESFALWPSIDSKFQEAWEKQQQFLGEKSEYEREQYKKGNRSIPQEYRTNEMDGIFSDPRGRSVLFAAIDLFKGLEDNIIF